MKKWFLAACLAAALVLSAPSVLALEDSEHYLPGGKNYLDPDNFEADSGYYNSIYNFLVKPNTTYCLSLARTYTDAQAGYHVILDYFANEAQTGTDTIEAVEFAGVSGQNWMFVLFTTSAATNYLDVYIFDPASSFDLHTADLFQLEEGSAFTGYEDFVPGNLADVNGPYFEGNGVVISNVDDPIASAEIRAGLVAVDAIDGDVSADIVELANGYAGHEDTLGEYVISYTVADTVGNATAFDITVKVVDVTAPMFGGETSFVAPYPVILPVATIQSQLTASDNYDGDLTGDITLKTDGYTANAGTIGAYALVFTVTDASGNATDRTVTVQVVDEADPIFSGPASYTIGYDVNLSVSDIQGALSAMDDYDLDLTAAITLKTDGYSAHLKQIGTYEVVFEAVDSSGNATQYNVIVHIVDGIGPIVYIDASIVRVYSGDILSLEDFTTLLVRAGEMSAAPEFRVTVRFDSYTAHAAEPGVYHLALEIERPDGAVVLKTFQVVVSEDRSIIVPGPGENPAEKRIGISDVVTWITGGLCAVLLAATNIIWWFKVKRR